MNGGSGSSRPDDPQREYVVARWGERTLVDEYATCCDCGRPVERRAYYDDDSDSPWTLLPWLPSVRVSKDNERRLAAVYAGEPLGNTARGLAVRIRDRLGV